MNPIVRCLLAALLFTALVPLGGCGSVLATLGAHPITITPVGKKAITAVVPNLQSVVYRVDRDKNIDIVMQDPRARKVAADRPSDDQRIVVHVFWLPRGGVTSLNDESINATFRYIVINATGAGMYEGAGFVRFYGKIGGAKLTARIRDGELRLTQATAGFVDPLGPAEFSGAFRARYSDSLTVARLLTDQRDFFMRTYKLAQADEAGTPATQPDAHTP